MDEQRQKDDLQKSDMDQRCRAPLHARPSFPAHFQTPLTFSMELLTARNMEYMVFTHHVLPETTIRTFLQELLTYFSYSCKNVLVLFFVALSLLFLFEERWGRSVHQQLVGLMLISS